MSPEAWGQVVSVVLQLVMAVVAGCVLPWVKKITSELIELRQSMDKSNRQISRLGRRVNRHSQRLDRLEGRQCGGEE